MILKDCILIKRSAALGSFTSFSLGFHDSGVDLLFSVLIIPIPVEFLVDIVVLVANVAWVWSEREGRIMAH